MESAMQVYRTITTRFDLENIYELDMQLLASEIMYYKRTGIDAEILKIIMGKLLGKLGDKKYEYL